MSLPDHLLDPACGCIVWCRCGEKGDSDNFSYLDGEYLCAQCASEREKENAMEQAVQVKLYLDGDVKGQKIVQEAILAALEEVGTCIRLDNFTSATIFSREIAVVVPQKQAEAQEAA